MRIYDTDGNILSDTENWQRQIFFSWLEEVPEFVLSGLLHREDRRFWNHRGVDLYALFRAMRENIRAGKFVQGWSTIDQQVIKLSQGSYYNRTLSQKIYEIFKARNINLWYTKEEIFLRYVNNLDFGNQVRWFATACEIFFHMECKQLTQSEQIYLLAQTKYPGRKDIVPYALSYAKTLWLTNITKDQLYAIQHSRFRADSVNVPFFVTYVKQLFVDKDLDSEINGIRFDSENNTIHTLFDSRIAENIQWILRTFTPYLHSQQAFDGCVVVMQGNDLISMNLVRSYGNDGTFVNGCLRKRQVWSAIKPFIYALALYKWIVSSGEKISDTPVSYLLDNGGVYEPQNFSMDFHGDVSIEDALGSSLNVPAVKILERIWIDDTYNFLRTIWTLVHMDEKWEDEVQTYGLSLALWSKDLSVLDFTRMWTIFQNKKNLDGRIINASVQQRNFFDVYAGSLVYIRWILGDNNHRLASFPQYNRFDIPGAYTKSWTSRWFVDGRVCGGYDDVTVCVWIGNYNGKPAKLAGYQLAGPVWHAVVQMLMR